MSSRVVCRSPPDGADTPDPDAVARHRFPVIECVRVKLFVVSTDSNLAFVDEILHSVASVSPYPLVAFAIYRVDGEDVS